MENVYTSEVHSSHFRGLWISCYYSQKNLNPFLFPKTNISLQSRFPYSPDRPSAEATIYDHNYSVKYCWSKIASRRDFILELTKNCVFTLTFCVSEDQPTPSGPCPGVIRVSNSLYCDNVANLSCNQISGPFLIFNFFFVMQPLPQPQQGLFELKLTRLIAFRNAPLLNADAASGHPTVMEMKRDLRESFW